ncbi:3'-5' exonuclease [Periweissella beninensis]|uniref:3'-5' exonuclease n=1 Tax=Periweissella beninensis TaxID=504936 RepID=A0ABT0VM86_9LACO|nr:3'-5' exonuclease [Periweissella beninensis]MBM7544540.1 DNA polymerase-3 subunit epsilon [Periweissella beninensis]MCM2438039.1 3'-5' exonuclease [Periweissella beninensis]MCT4395818.1 exonuclease [Periweissella beninensis]
MDFIAIDFETANPSRNSAVSLALTIVRDNSISDEFYTLINPQTTFHRRNIQIHGITSQDVVNAPTFPLIWEQIKMFFTSDQLVIAHNAPFDNSVLKNTLLSYNLIVPTFLSLDTARLSKQLLPHLVNHKLNTVANALDIPLVHHHNALDDSLAAANILLKEYAQFGETPINQAIKLYQS